MFTITNIALITIVPLFMAALQLLCVYKMMPIHAKMSVKDKKWIADELTMLKSQILDLRIRVVTCELAADSDEEDDDIVVPPANPILGRF